MNLLGRKISNEDFEFLDDIRLWETKLNSEEKEKYKEKIERYQDDRIDADILASVKIFLQEDYIEIILSDKKRKSFGICYIHYEW